MIIGIAWTKTKTRKNKTSDLLGNVRLPTGELELKFKNVGIGLNKPLRNLHVCKEILVGNEPTWTLLTDPCKGDPSNITGYQGDFVTEMLHMGLGLVTEGERFLWKLKDRSSYYHQPPFFGPDRIRIARGKVTEAFVHQWCERMGRDVPVRIPIDLISPQGRWVDSQGEYLANEIRSRQFS